MIEKWGGVFKFEKWPVRQNFYLVSLSDVKYFSSGMKIMLSFQNNPLVLGTLKLLTYEGNWYIIDRDG